ARFPFPNDVGSYFHSRFHSCDKSSSPILQPSILIAPVPYFSTQSATVSLRPVSASFSGFLTTMIGSWLGLSEVPHPSHLRASSVAGAVMSYSLIPLPPSLPQAP